MNGNPDILLKKANGLLEQYKSELAEDKAVPDMRELDAIIRKICQLVVSLPKNEAKKYNDAMHKIEKSLSGLAEKMEIKKAEIKTQIENTGYNKKAQVAYRVADKLARPKKED